MLEDLRIKDFALIDSAALDFKNGFTVLSGETGAGKSLLIGALTFLLGGKGGVEQIRSGCSQALVSGTFYIKGLSNSQDVCGEDEEPQTPAQWLNQHGISSEDDRILLRRIVKDSGKSGAWIGDTPVTRSDLASFCSFLIDIHGQHEHQSLMKIPEHRKFLDSYAGIAEQVNDFTKLYAELVSKRKTLSEMVMDDKSRQEKIEILNFAVKEIEDAKLKSAEDQELEEEETRLSSFEKLYSDLESVNELLGGSEGEGAVSILKKCRSFTQHASSMDKTLSSLESRLDSAFYELSDIADEYSKYMSGLVFDPERLSFVQERLTLMYNLKKKYASSVNAPLDEVLKFHSDATKRLEELSGGAKSRDELVKQIEELEKKVYSAARNISALRKAASVKMSESVVEILRTLGMKDAKFAVSVTEKSGSAVEQKCGPYGMDDIEFLIAANPGNPLQSLAKIASGGELSRVMLSLKTVFAETDIVDTLIFDEIDTGIGGEVAVSIGSHIKKLAQKHQILCITHLASIAVYADNQLKIEKGVSNGVTSTQVNEISGEQRVLEIARMLSGDTTTQTSLEHARSMLEKFSNFRG